MFCFELLAARSVASTHREARPGPPRRLMLDQRFPNLSTTDLTSDQSSLTSSEPLENLLTVIYSSLFSFPPPLETPPVFPEGA